ncbi:hypothetical protein THRCLA_21645 [Thraustotheca clavata]|uniref:Uncharacterized protein n=1 Tax=Thraustotheca clavata TaxID=74557 RepID=A0A1V9ZSN9_9STRA|nr:hypothetical protein THRCLA_21645 [Thraustotheca clavata]
MAVWISNVPSVVTDFVGCAVEIGWVMKQFIVLPYMHVSARNIAFVVIVTAGGVIVAATPLLLVSAGVAYIFLKKRIKKTILDRGL